MKKTTVLVVDDSSLIRTLFTEILNSAPDIEVIGTANDPIDAREKIKRLNPQVLTLDIEMPKMDGLSFLDKIMSLRPMPVVMASTLTHKGAAETIRALELGAIDYISKPQGDEMGQALARLQVELVEKVRAAAQANMRFRSVQNANIVRFSPKSGTTPYVIAIGSSTGGVETLRDIFLTLPGNCPPIVIAQHMPEQFTPSFAARLNGLSQVNVTEARHGVRLEQGHAYLAPGNQHLTVKRIGGNYISQLDTTATVSGHRPSVDVLFQSVAQSIGANAVGIMLTGMGKDGAAGMLAMREQGAYNIGQDKETSVVYGMPRMAWEAGGVHIQLPLSAIAEHALNYCEQERRIPNAS